MEKISSGPETNSVSSEMSAHSSLSDYRPQNKSRKTKQVRCKRFKYQNISNELRAFLIQKVIDEKQKIKPVISALFSYGDINFLSLRLRGNSELIIPQQNRYCKSIVRKVEWTRSWSLEELCIIFLLRKKPLTQKVQNLTIWAWMWKARESAWLNSTDTL